MAVPKTQKEKYSDYFTYAQYKHWPDDECWELIDGDTYNMGPAPDYSYKSKANRH